ncbi:MAG: FKBP-type peptidyl-prolyl cis-trans isomerase [Eggerthellaceae bacterium]|jgi:FKBP-type peptidyl-prolyl cis-trans isomerase 2
MSNAGKTVSVHYTGTLDDGTKFDSSYDRNKPLTFVCMSGQMIPGFDKAVDGMEVGETVNVHIPCAEAYGEHRDDLVQKVPLENIPNSDQLPLGERVFLQTTDGQPLSALVAAMDDTYVTFDFNSEMAGKDLNFEITLVEVQ